MATATQTEAKSRQNHPTSRDPSRRLSPRRIDGMIVSAGHPTFADTNQPAPKSQRQPRPGPRLNPYRWSLRASGAS